MCLAERLVCHRLARGHRKRSFRGDTSKLLPVASGCQKDSIVDWAERSTNTSRSAAPASGEAIEMSWLETASNLHRGGVVRLAAFPLSCHGPHLIIRPPFLTFSGSGAGGYRPSRAPSWHSAASAEPLPQLSIRTTFTLHQRCPLRPLHRECSTDVASAPGAELQINVGHFATLGSRTAVLRRSKRSHLVWEVTARRTARVSSLFFFRPSFEQRISICGAPGELWGPTPFPNDPSNASPA